MHSGLIFKHSDGVNESDKEIFGHNKLDDEWSDHVQREK